MHTIFGIALFLFFAVFIPAPSQGDSVVRPADYSKTDFESFRMLKVYTDQETDTPQPWLQLYPGRCNEKCQTEFNKCVESKATKKNCDGRLYNITGIYGYEFPCGEKEIWLMEFSAVCRAKGNPYKPDAEFTGHITCVAGDAAKQCEMAGDACAVDCRNSGKIDRDLSYTIPSPTAKQRGVVRPALNSTDIRRE